MKQTFTIGAFGLIKDEQNRILLQLRNDLKVRGLPWWAVENAESPREAVIREVKEETGFDVEMIRLFGIYVKPEENDVWIWFECKIIGGKKTLSEESDDIQFFALDEIPENNLPRHIERIKDYFENKDLVMKIHKGKAPIKKE
jgi:ADP-ribose pyrophosphatase YjhB (NUDIX family)